MAKLMQRRPVPVDRLEIGLRGWGADEVAVRVVVGSLAADPQVGAAGPDQRLNLGQDHAVGRGWGGGRDRRRQVVALVRVEHRTPSTPRKPMPARRTRRKPVSPPAASGTACPARLDPQPSRHPRHAEGICRRHGSVRRPAAALTSTEVRGLLRACGGELPGLRDRALLLLGFAGALRRSELVGIDVEHLRVAPIGYYNGRRPHSSLGGLTPDEAYAAIGVGAPRSPRRLLSRLQLPLHSRRPGTPALRAAATTSGQRFSPRGQAAFPPALTRST